jgi:hypothetical protein
MAKYNHTNANDVPVRMTFTAMELKRMCEILHREVENKGSDRHFARDLHATLTEALTEAGRAMEIESRWVANHVIQHLADGMNDAQDKADKVVAAE